MDELIRAARTEAEANRCGPGSSKMRIQTRDIFCLACRPGHALAGLCAFPIVALLRELNKYKEKDRHACLIPSTTSAPDEDSGFSSIITRLSDWHRCLLRRRFSGHAPLAASTAAGVNCESPVYKIEGSLGQVCKNPSPGTSPLYRCYSPGLQDHMTTKDRGCEGSPLYQLDGVIGYIHDQQVPASIPLTRCYSASLHDHMDTLRSGKPGSPCEGSPLYVHERVLGYVAGVTPQALPKIISPIGKWKFYGCYSDGIPRIFPYLKYGFHYRDMTPDKCLDIQHDLQLLQPLLLRPPLLLLRLLLLRLLLPREPQPRLQQLPQSRPRLRLLHRARSRLSDRPD
ncbi:hypothetical protein HRG_014302 [Hirsutella rhossiliensis]